SCMLSPIRRASAMMLMSVRSHRLDAFPLGRRCHGFSWTKKSLLHLLENGLQQVNIKNVQILVFGQPSLEAREFPGWTNVRSRQSPDKTQDGHRIKRRKIKLRRIYFSYRQGLCFYQPSQHLSQITKQIPPKFLLIIKQTQGTSLEPQNFAIPNHDLFHQLSPPKSGTYTALKKLLNTAEFESFSSISPRTIILPPISIGLIVRLSTSVFGVIDSAFVCRSFAGRDATQS